MKLHSLLARQLRRLQLSADEPPDAAGWQAILQRVSRVYGDADNDRYTLERSLELSGTEMREVYQELAAERDKLHATFRALSIAIVQLDTTGCVRFANPAATTLLAEAGGELVGQQLSSVARFTVAGEEVGQQVVVRSCAEGRIWRSGDVELQVEGESRPVALAIHPMGTGGSGGAVLAVQDLSDIRRAEIALREARIEAEAAHRAEQSRAEFLANMSHELRTPLNAIIGYGEMLAETHAAEAREEDVEDLNRILSAGRHLLHLINDILDLSKIEVGKLEPFHEAVDLPGLLAEVVDVVRPLAAQNGNQFALRIRGEPAVVCIDQVRVKQCLLNLLSNACKFTLQGDVRLAVRCERRESTEWIVFEVCDTGIGMSPDQIESVFQAFTQAERSTTRRFGGTGLGLALTQRLARLMGGDVWVESTPGLGSTFTLEIPTTEESVRHFLPVDPVEPLMVVLSIDDDPAMHELLWCHLQSESVHLVATHDGQLGRQLAEELCPQLVLLDLHLPVVDGWQVLAELKADPKTRAIPVVILSMAEDRKRGFASGADGYMAKPLRRDDLLDLIERHRPDLSDRVEALVP
ncbi:MAG: response regulator [Myxococcales bacterium]|nr:response regulator [Myxococcales bacterium]